MNQAYIDNGLIALAIIFAAIVSICLRRRITGFLFSTFLLVPPLLVFLNMWAHTVAVTVVNIRRYQTGSFQYSFSFYSHILFGLVFIVLSGTAIHFTRQYICGQRKQKRFIHLLNAATSILFIPVGFLNPIGFLPVIASFVSTLTLLIYDPFKMRQMLKRRKPVRAISATGRITIHKQSAQ
jgi:hypothetical protein